MSKNEFDSTDVAPVIGYGHDGTASRKLHTNSTGDLFVLALNTLVPAEYDEIVLSYTGSDVTGVVYKLATVTVATLTLTYTDSKLTGVVKS